ncbi:MAG: DUF1289 domain-containing protein [Methylovulum sp.]|nr:MAG: DUF1289 domain-containing protein [Methylovulum sp.]
MAANSESIDSPCVRNCCLNTDDICLGCFRSLYEIINWAQADDTLRREYLNNADKRRSRQKRPMALATYSGRANETIT